MISRILKSPLLVIAALAVAGLTVMFAANTPSAEAGTKPHSLRGIAHGNTVELFWSAPSSPPAGNYRYVVFRRIEGESTFLKCYLAEWSNSPAKTWTDDGTCDETVGDSNLQAENDAYAAAGIPKEKYYYYVKINTGWDTNNGKPTNTPATSYFKALVTSSERRSMAAKYKAFNLKTRATNDGHIKLNWKLVSTYRINGYTIHRKASGENWTILVDDTNDPINNSKTRTKRKFIDDTVESGTMYAYRVQARYRPSGCSTNACENKGLASAYSQTRP